MQLLSKNKTRRINLDLFVSYLYSKMQYKMDTKVAIVKSMQLCNEI